MYSVQFILYTVQFIMYTVQFIMYTVQFIMYTVQFILYTLQNMYILKGSYLRPSERAWLPAPLWRRVQHGDELYSTIITLYSLCYELYSCMNEQ